MLIYMTRRLLSLSFTVGLYRTYISSAEGDKILEEARTESSPGVRAFTFIGKYESFFG